MGFPRGLLLLDACYGVWYFGTSWTVACHFPLSMGFSRQEYWSGLPFPPPGHLLDPGTEPPGKPPEVKNLLIKARDTRDTGSIRGSGRYPGERNGNSVQYSYLENPMKEQPGRLQSMGLQRVSHNWEQANSLRVWHFINRNFQNLFKERRFWNNIIIVENI